MTEAKILLNQFDILKRKRKIEFVGDSYFTGFESKGDSPDGMFQPRNRNSYSSFGPQLARKLDADYSYCCNFRIRRYEKFMVIHFAPRGIPAS
ncbi:MAG: hypothetical protein U5J96_15615 [Ignavibacteriaceae bacterium]|nr:hypothetical protein [Ignavibacteriaceae bacterium]